MYSWIVKNVFMYCFQVRPRTLACWEGVIVLYIDHGWVKDYGYCIIKVFAMIIWTNLCYSCTFIWHQKNWGIML